MIICKNLKINDVIRTTNEWFEKCPPQGREKHWVDGRSAKETAKAWINGMPIQFTETVKPLKFSAEIVSPEFITKFDKLTGGGRNHDLLILDPSNKIVASIESKVDESFGEGNLAKFALNVEIVRDKRPTQADVRLEGLKEALFNNPKSKKLDPLMYQLLIGVAGVLSEAKNQKYKTSVFLIQTFLSHGMDSKKHRDNQRALDYFLEIISNGKYKIIHDGDLLGPIRVPGNNEKILNDIDLYIGKYSIKL